MKPSTPTKLLAILMLAVTGAAIGPKPESDVRQDKAGTAGAVAVPLPVEKTNCVRCHLTAGRELTVPVYQFARSVHDRAKMSCNDCHGGNTADDATAHEHEFGFIGTKLSAHIGACADCHMEEADLVQKGAHFWDVTKRINRDYPLCIDCHHQQIFP
jgi:hypothetical protein